MAYELDLSWDSGSTGNVEAPLKEPLSVVDALVHCMRDLVRVDIAYIAELSDKPEEYVVAKLGNAIYRDPETQQWELAPAYLSGNLNDRLVAARKASIADPSYLRNVKALEEAMPPRVATEDIHVQIGSPWVPEDVILEFIYHLLPKARNSGISIRHDPVSGTWTIRGKENVSHWVGSWNVWGTKRMSALRIIEVTLNGRDIRVYDEVERDHGRGTRRVLNRDETMAAIEKQELLSEEFDRWVWTDPAHKELLEKAFYERYCTFVTQRFDGSILEFPGMSPHVRLRPYQADAVMRMLTMPTVLLAHDVGTGKTYTCIAAGMEMRRLNPDENILYIVPNNVVEQWADLFGLMYSDADVLVVDPYHFRRPWRESVLQEIASGTHDATIMAASCFDLIPFSREFKVAKLDQYLADLEEAADDEQRATTSVKASRNAAEKRRAKLIDQEKEPEGLTFEDLGITRLFVDEAHNYKNLPVEGTASVAGVSTKGSSKCVHLFDAVRHTLRSGGGVVFATGTVLTNSIADCYAFQRYLQPFTLRALDIESFEAWVNMFARRITDWEIDVDTSTYHITTRYAGFGNLEGLSAIFANVADFHHLDASDGLPARKDVNVVVKRTQVFSDYLHEIGKRADLVRSGLVSSKDDNLLKICTDGRKAALDIRLVIEAARLGRDCKVFACADIVARIWRETMRERCTQIVFCDTSTPREGFNVYDELKDRLVERGVVADEIAFIHDATSKTARNRLFAAMREGKVRVIVGSTAKLGLGVNIQDRLVAVHHLDVPWRPADMTQREGRAIREGNTNGEVTVYRYVTEGSFDAYSWQLLERKQRTIDELLAGTFKGGFLEADIGGEALTYGEVKALAVGSPLLRERVECANELERTRILQRHAVAARARLKDKALEMAGAVDAGEAQIRACEKDAQFARTTTASHLTKDERRERGEQILNGAMSNLMSPKDVSLGTYRGFRLCVPAWADPEEPQICILRSGRWFVCLKDARALGVIKRIDNVIDGLKQHAEELTAALETLTSNWEQAEQELAEAKDTYQETIDQLRAKLAAIDVALEEARHTEEENHAEKH